jgi:aspartate-semialdehyde dehydrogenase
LSDTYNNSKEINNLVSIVDELSPNIDNRSSMTKLYKIAIVGATGAVGQEMLRILEARNFPIEEIRCFASPKSLGQSVLFKGEKIPLRILDDSAFKDIDLALFSAGKKISLEFAPKAVQAGAVVVDNSSGFRMDPEVPLVIPEVNPEALLEHKGIIASPNCTATILLMALAPLHRLFQIKRIVLSTYQAASGAGAGAMHELKEETLAFFTGTPFKRTVMPHPYAFNLFLHNAPMTDDKYNEEELKVIEETRKILQEPSLPMAVTCVRVPILRAHSESINVEFHKPITAEEACAILSQSPGVTLLEDWKGNRFPMPSDASFQDNVFVGRIREDRSQKNTLDLWVVGDQLLKGAALNAVQIAETIIRGSCYV